MKKNCIHKVRIKSNTFESESNLKVLSIENLFLKRVKSDNNDEVKVDLKCFVKNFNNEILIHPSCSNAFKLQFTSAIDT